MKKLRILLYVLVFNMVGMLSVSATDNQTVNIDTLKSEKIDFMRTDDTKYTEDVPCVTKSVRWSILPGKIQKNSTCFPLKTNEVVNINVVFTSADADVEFGLISPDGLFYSVQGMDGWLDRTIRVDQSGDYYFAVRNNSDNTVKAKGFIYFN